MLARALPLLFLAISVSAEAGNSSLLPTYCSGMIQTLETPFFIELNPSEAIINFVNRKRFEGKFEKFDWDFYRAKKIEYRDQLNLIPEPGIFEANIAWFEVYLEKEGLDVFDFEKAIEAMPREKIFKIMAFFKGNPFNPAKKTTDFFDNVNTFFSLIDHEPIMAAELVGHHQVHAVNELAAKQMAISIAARGLERLFESLGYLPKKGIVESLKRFLDSDPIKLSKVGLFNYGLTKGVPVLYMPPIEDVQFTSDEIDTYLLKGTQISEDDALLTKKVKNRLVRKEILKVIRKRVIELNLVLGVFYSMGAIAEKIESRAAVKAILVENERRANQAIDQESGNIDSLEIIIDDLTAKIGVPDSATPKTSGVAK